MKDFLSQDDIENIDLNSYDDENVSTLANHLVKKLMIQTEESLMRKLKIKKEDQSALKVWIKYGILRAHRDGVAEGKKQMRTELRSLLGFPIEEDE